MKRINTGIGLKGTDPAADHEDSTTEVEEHKYLKQELLPHASTQSEGQNGISVDTKEFGEATEAVHGQLTSKER